jgi:hypothetical protein
MTLPRVLYDRRVRLVAVEPIRKRISAEKLTGLADDFGYNLDLFLDYTSKL